MENRNFYNVCNYSDKLDVGEEIRINHSISLNKNDADFTKIQNLPENILKDRRAQSAEKEKVIFEKLCKSVEEWEKQAANTMMFDKVLEFQKFKPVEHTSNEWKKNKYGNRDEISNMVYKMYYRISANTKYDHQLQKTVPVSWHLDWSVITNAPAQNYYKINGQTRKLFYDMAEMERYLERRKAAYAHLFTEISPPIPETYEHLFRVNGMLMRGYKLESDEAPPIPPPIKITVTMPRNNKKIKSKRTPARGEAR